MFDALKEFVTYTVPWWTWSVPTVAAGVVAFVAVSRVVGWRNALIITLGYAVAVVTFLAQARGRQQGWKDRIKQENKDAEQTIARANAARDRSRKRNVGHDRLYADDGFKRRS